MVKKTQSKLIIYFAFALLMITSAFSTLQLDSTTTTPSVIKPGDEVDLTVRVQNVVSDNGDPTYSYVLEIEPKGTLSEENIIIVDGTYNIGKLGSNEYWNSKFTFKVKEGAPSSKYEFDLVIKRYYEGSLVSSFSRTITLDVVGETFFNLDSEEKTIQQGETKTFQATLSNVGGSSAGSVKLNFGNTDSIQVVGTNTFYFSTVNYNEKESFNITLHASNNVESGTYNFPVTITYNDGTQIRTQDIVAGIIVGGNIDLRVASVETTPKEIRPGDNYVLISLNLENTGEDDAKAISAHLKSDDFESSYSDDNYVYSGRIDSGSYSNMKFYIDVPKNISSGVYNLNLGIDYMNLMNEDFETTLNVPLHIKEKPILEIANVQAEGKAGNTIDVIVDVKNTGEEDAQEVDIRLISDSSLPFSVEERSVYLGSIDSGESKKAIFNVKVNKEADLKEYNIRAFLRARGDSEIGDNNIYTYNKDVNIDVTGKAINKLALFGVLVALIVVIGLLFRKKKKPFKKQKKE